MNEPASLRGPGVAQRDLVEPVVGDVLADALLTAALELTTVVRRMNSGPKLELQLVELGDSISSGRSATRS